MKVLVYTPRGFCPQDVFIDVMIDNVENTISGGLYFLEHCT